MYLVTILFLFACVLYVFLKQFVNLIALLRSHAVISDNALNVVI